MAWFGVGGAWTRGWLFFSPCVLNSDLLLEFRFDISAQSSTVSSFFFFQNSLVGLSAGFVTECFAFASVITDHLSFLMFSCELTLLVFSFPPTPRYISWSIGNFAIHFDLFSLDNTTFFPPWAFFCVCVELFGTSMHLFFTIAWQKYWFVFVLFYSTG